MPVTARGADARRHRTVCHHIQIKRLCETCTGQPSGRRSHKLKPGVLNPHKASSQVQSPSTKSALDALSHDRGRPHSENPQSNDDFHPHAPTAPFDSNRETHKGVAQWPGLSKSLRLSAYPCPSKLRRTHDTRRLSARVERSMPDFCMASGQGQLHTQTHNRKMCLSSGSNRPGQVVLVRARAGCPVETEGVKHLPIHMTYCKGV